MTLVDHSRWKLSFLDDTFDEKVLESEYHDTCVELLKTWFEVIDEIPYNPPLENQYIVIYMDDLEIFNEKTLYETKNSS